MSTAAPADYFLAHLVARATQHGPRLERRQPSLFEPRGTAVQLAPPEAVDRDGHDLSAVPMSPRQAPQPSAMLRDLELDGQEDVASARSLATTPIPRASPPRRPALIDQLQSVPMGSRRVFHGIEATWRAPTRPDRDPSEPD